MTEKAPTQKTPAIDVWPEESARVKRIDAQVARGRPRRLAMALDIAIRRLASRAIDALGLRRPVFRLREWMIALRDRRAGTAADGRSLPSAYLRTLVVGTADLDWFLQSGERDAAEFDAVLSRHGYGLFGAGRVLEWGCGCGRLSRWVAPRVEAFTGVDINPRLIRWCASHLPGRYRAIRFLPPAPLAEGAFDVVFGCSVLTHLREESAHLWLAELARVLRPGGLALLTFHDAEHPGAASVRERLARDGYAVRFDRLEGSNHLAAYAAPERLAAMAAPAFDLHDYVPSSQSTSLQALIVFKKR